MLLALTTTWPGFEAWQPQMETLTPADTAGQSFVLEFDHPRMIELLAALPPSQAAGRSSLVAQVTILSPSSTTYADLPVLIDPAQSRLQVSLAGVSAGAGSHLRVVLRDSEKQTWIWGAEHESYPPGERTLGGRPVGGDLAFRVYYQRSLIDLCREGFRVALGSWQLLLAFAVTVGSAGLLVSGGVRRMKALDPAALLSAAIGGGLPIAALLGLAAAMLRIRMSAGLVFVAAGVMGFFGLWLWSRPARTREAMDLSAIGLVVCVLLFGSLRLAFASATDLPPHVDSVEHFLLVSDLLAPDRPPVAANNVADLATRYYHLGFHAMAAWMLALAGVSTPHSLLVLGQLMQTAVIGAVYFPVYAAVRDARAALVAVLLAGVGWSMPSYASNWAKYPALLGLAVLPVVGGMTILGLGARGKRRYLALMAAGLAALVSVLIHTRMLFLIAAFILSIEFARRQGLRDEERGFKRRWILPIAVLLLIAVPSVLLASSANIEAARQTVLRFVYGQGLVSTLLVLLLTPFALRSHRAASLAAISLASLILLFQLLPPNASYPFPILDAPMASMALFLPLSCLGGLGASGIDSYLRSARLGPRVGRYGRPALAFGAVLYVAWSLSVQPESPGECCLLARQDDVTVVKAASGLLPPDSRTLIPSEAQVGYGPLASDGGAWLFALAQRRTILWPSDADLSSPSEHARLCAQDISYIYVGGTPWGFSREMLDLAPAFYAPTIALPGAAIYSVKGCEVSRGKPGQFGIESSPTALRRDQGCPASAQGCELRPGRDPV